MLSRCMVSRVKHNSYFLVGLFIGLWVSLAVIPFEEEPAACTATQSVSNAAPFNDEFEPQREEKPASAYAQAAGRSVQRPRYYSTELGMRGSLVSGVLSSEEALKNQVVALNHTAARLQPALKIFITASAMSSVPGLANVVGFTDTREMLKPFHALKYLADNYLEEYDFFFLVSDTAFVNSRRLTELVSQLSVSQDVYMGVIAEDESHYCSLDSGIILSNSVLRAIHNELDWCVRNSYSPHHHENIGRCVLHAAHLSCTSELQGEQYSAVQAPEAGALQLEPALADAVTVHPLDQPHRFYQLHAYVSRVYLQRDREQVVRLRAYLWRNSARHPPQFRNSTWPAGLRDEPGMARPLPDTRFDHLRWTAFNATHAFMPDEHRNAAALSGAHRLALDAVVRRVRAWALQRWRGALEVQVAEGAWRWEPAVALRYRLLVRLRARDSAAHTLRWVEVVRPLGAARLVPVRYVTESARVTLVVGVWAGAGAGGAAVADARRFLQHYDAVCLGQDKNTALLLVLVQGEGADNATATAGAGEGEGEGEEVRGLRADAAALVARFPATQLDVLEARAEAGAGAGEAGEPETEDEALRRASSAALGAAVGRVARDTLLLVVPPHAEFNQDFVNRVRMNAIAGEQWYLPVAFSRYAQYAHPRFLTPDGAKPQVNTGRFNPRRALALAFYRADYDAAVSEWAGASPAPAPSPAELLAHSALRCVRAPDPGLVLAPRPPPCLPAPQCARGVRARGLGALDLGAKHALAQLLLETQAEREG